MHIFKQCMYRKCMYRMMLYQLHHYTIADLCTAFSLLEMTTAVSTISWDVVIKMSKAFLCPRGTLRDLDFSFELTTQNSRNCELDQQTPNNTYFNSLIPTIPIFNFQLSNNTYFNSQLTNNTYFNSLNCLTLLIVASG